jgi:hypothetical protein
MKYWLNFVGLCFVTFSSFNFIFLGLQHLGIFGGILGLLVFLLFLYGTKYYFKQFLGKCPICKKDGIPRESIKCPFCQSVIK